MTVNRQIKTISEAIEADRVTITYESRFAVEARWSVAAFWYPERHDEPEHVEVLATGSTPAEALQRAVIRVRRLLLTRGR